MDENKREEITERDQWIDELKKIEDTYVKTQKILQESETKFRTLFDLSPQAITLTEIETGKLIDVNEKFCELTKYTKEEILGTTTVQFGFYSEEDRNNKVVKKLKEQGQVLGMEMDFRAKDGSTLHALIFSRIIYLHGKPLILSVFLDRTKCIQMEDELKESEAKFRALIEKIPNTVIYTAALDERSRTLYVSPQIKEILGYTQEEYKEDPDIWDQRFHPEDRERVLAERQHCRETGKPFVSEYRMFRKDGQTIWFHDEAHIVQDEHGKPLFLLGVNTNITERKESEEALKARERELNIKTKNLEEVNAALNVLLKKREEDKVELEERVLLNVKQLIIPYIAKLKRSGLDERQNAIAAILESNLNEIISSFTHTLSSRHLNLTPKEVKIANLIKEGKTSKEICELLGFSPEAVAFHRGNIRRKLGIKNKKVNLKSYLVAKINSKLPDLD